MPNGFHTLDLFHALHRLDMCHDRAGLANEADTVATALVHDAVVEPAKVSSIPSVKLVAFEVRDRLAAPEVD